MTEITMPMYEDITRVNRVVTKNKARTAAERKAAERKRRKDQGLKRVEAYIKPENEGKFRRLVALLS